jgi:hypothetical protein
LKSEPVDAHLLADADKKPLKWTRDGQGIAISLPGSAPSPISSTVAVQVKGVLDVEDPALP